MVFAGPEGSYKEDVEGIATVKLFATNVAKLINKIKD